MEPDQSNHEESSFAYVLVNGCQLSCSIFCVQTIIWPTVLQIL